MVLTQEAAQARERALAERPCPRGLAEHGEIAGEVRGARQRIVVVAGEPLVEARKGGLVQQAGSGRVAGHPQEQREVAGTCMVVRMVGTIDLGVARHRALGQRERLLGLADRPLNIGQADGRGKGIWILLAEKPSASLVYIGGKLERIVVTARDPP